MISFDAYIYIHMFWHWAGLSCFMIYCMGIHSVEFALFGLHVLGRAGVADLH